MLNRCFKKCLNFFISFGFSCNRTCRCNSQRVSQMWTRVWKLLPWRHPASRRPASRRSRLRWTLLRVNPGNPDGADASRRSRSRWTYWCFWWCCQDTGRYIGKLLRDMWWCLKIMVKVNFGWQWWYRYDDASGHSWSRWPLITRSLTTCWLPRLDCSLWRRTFNEWLPCEKLLAQRFVKMSWNALPSIFKWSRRTYQKLKQYIDAQDWMRNIQFYLIQDFVSNIGWTHGRLQPRAFGPDRHPSCKVNIKFIFHPSFI